MNYYTYIYLDPRKPGNYEYTGLCLLYQPFYVGKGKNTRYKQHLKDYHINRTNNHHKNSKIKKLKKLYKTTELQTFILVFVHENESSALLYEKNLIDCIGRSDFNNGPLTNLTDGGEG